MDSKILAITVVIVVVAAAGVGAVVMLNGDDGGSSKTYDSSYLGLVYGNSDGDCDIDEDDIKIIEQIIEDASLSAKYPFADANNDGVVNVKDKELVQKMIDRESMDIYVVDDTGSAVKSHFPLTRIFTNGGTNARVVSSVLGLEKFIVANATNEKTIGETLDKGLNDLRNSGTITIVTTSATDSDKTALSAVDFQAAVLETTGMSGYGSDAFQSLYSSKNVSFLQFNFDNAKKSLQSVATIGILVGSEERAERYIDFCNGVLNTIKSAEGDKYGSATIMSVVMTNSVSGTISDYYNATVMAGGNNLADFNTSTKKFPDGTDKTWLLDPKYNPDYLVHYSSVTFGSEPAAKTVKAIEDNFSETSAFKNGGYYLMNGVLPLPVRLAYTAEIMYPDLFESGYGLSTLQKYMDDFTHNPGFDASAVKVLWNTGELKAL